jgi:hypothetical protein
MAYGEVRMMDIHQVIRRWLAGVSIRAVGRSTGLDRNTVRRLDPFGSASWSEARRALAREIAISRLRFQSHA